MVGPKKLKKIKFVANWKTAKSVTKTAMRRDFAKRRKEERGDQAELRIIKEDEAEFKQLFAMFKGGLTPTLKALENAKTPEDQVKYCKDGLYIIKLYEKAVGDFNQRHLQRAAGMDVPRTTATLGGMLQRIRKDLSKGIRAG